MVVPVRFHRFRVWADQRTVSERTAAAGQSPIVSFAGREPGQRHNHPAATASWGGGVVLKFLASFPVLSFARAHQPQVCATTAAAGQPFTTTGSRAGTLFVHAASRFLSPTVEHNP